MADLAHRSWAVARIENRHAILGAPEQFANLSFDLFGHGHAQVNTNRLLVRTKGGGDCRVGRLKVGVDQGLRAGESLAHVVEPMGRNLFRKQGL